MIDIAKAKPILFSALMIQAIIDGRKKCTRRVVKPQPPQFVDYFEKRGDGFKAYMVPGEPCDYPLVKPKYQPGDILWVRETVWQRLHSTLRETRGYSDEEWFYWGSEFRYAATDKEPKEGNWVKRPSIHMPRIAARIFLVVKNVELEKLQDISEEDARDEGILLSYRASDKRVCRFQNYRDAFRALWDDLNKKRGYGWNMNPWVWAYEFEDISREVVSK